MDVETETDLVMGSAHPYSDSETDSGKKVPGLNQLVARDPQFSESLLVGWAKQVLLALWKARAEMAFYEVGGVLGEELLSQLKTDIEKLREEGGQVYTVGPVVENCWLEKVDANTENDELTVGFSIMGSSMNLDAQGKVVSGTHVGPHLVQNLTLARKLGELTTKKVELCPQCGAVRPVLELLGVCQFCGKAGMGVGGWVVIKWANGDDREEEGTKGKSMNHESVDLREIAKVITDFNEADFLAEARTLFYRVVDAREQGNKAGLEGKIEGQVEGELLDEERDEQARDVHRVEVIDIMGARIVRVETTPRPLIEVEFTLMGSDFVRGGADDRIVSGNEMAAQFTERWQFDWDGDSWLVARTGDDRLNLRDFITGGNGEG